MNADLFYPLPRLLGGGPDFYLFGQSFIGYGEHRHLGCRQAERDLMSTGPHELSALETLRIHA
ncbi:hypothetical protein ATN00_01120 [Sphingobium baderi]|uniref:Uncharacterized protein n=1 Tax=Sphingobium baderi TaxID=1332080 RepID=A0A0S3EUL9_9SPHN|nr:hypothetical protein ATN00_01120 [Sphingobium baderi]